jgi:hypothetical protein
VASSPTRIPPVSRVAFHVKPKSFRLILVLAEIATRVLPQGSLVGGVGPSTAKWRNFDVLASAHCAPGSFVELS